MPFKHSVVIIPIATTSSGLYKGFLVSLTNCYINSYNNKCSMYFFHVTVHFLDHLNLCG